MVSEALLETIIKKAFSKTWEISMNDGFLKKNHTHANYFRSAKFVYEVAQYLWVELYSESGKETLDKKLHVQYVDDKGNKAPGEWLYDICITKTKEIIEYRGQKKASANINAKILWAIESESATSLAEFCADFGKLICSGAQNCLYLHGLDQTKTKGRKDFINRRLSTIKDNHLMHTNASTNFYIGFWPSPKKVRSRSIWDYKNHSLNTLLNWIELHKL
jgi:hypothetical protein